MGWNRRDRYTRSRVRNRYAASRKLNSTARVMQSGLELFRALEYKPLRLLSNPGPRSAIGGVPAEATSGR